MFRELFGLPAHALIVHAAVVFIPLAAIGAILYALWPSVRRQIWWAVIPLAVLAPVTAWVARLSGVEYKNYWLANGVAGQALDEINKHEAYGNTLAWWATGFAVATLAMVLVIMPGPVALGRVAGGGAAAVRLATVIVVVALAAVTLYYVVLTGDAGARVSHPDF